MSLLHLNFESEYLHFNTDVNIIMPDRPKNITPEEFYLSGEKYKVLYLLHGTYGDYSDWIRKSNIEVYAAERNLVVVMPSAGNSYYSNWSTMMGINVRDYLIKELMPLINGWLPVSDKREDTFIAGLSMGGEGTLKYAVNHPDKFAAAAVLSMYSRDYAAIPPEKADRRTLDRYNAVGGFENFINSYENTRELLLRHKDDGTLPRLMFTIGEDDFLWEGYCEFKKWAVENGIKAEFYETPGYTHEWRFWDLEIQRALDFFGIEKFDPVNFWDLKKDKK
ncbi:MAG: alpha/beta hydrolase family protein [Oscillospiraceae bacterium]|nr:alpha/beta hydrolase family protein [Oscillospiraceae bacterium]